MLDARRAKCVALGFGSNLGDRREHLRRGLSYLAHYLRVLAVSSLFETDAVGLVDQPAFLNAVALVETPAPPEQVLEWALQAEQAEGRERDMRWGPRTLDVDVLLYANETIVTRSLVIPHPRLAERAFVLAPLAELVPGWLHPSLKKPIATLLAEVGTAGIIRVEGPDWPGAPRSVSPPRQR
ncbi:MAG: 2-amino-4-hydroxy-6-hydroxymethyldihydropteridine diphosphokinase [Dehalococcoidia bacterium]|nr:2-amino-4-hydroxy-6-hydroxymethyldihydropteridine diphosphokinase [Dehalococcoidia bacterium]